MAAIAKAPARLPLLVWLGQHVMPRTGSRPGAPADARHRRGGAASHPAFAQMPDHLRQDLDIDGGARMAQTARRSGWPIW